LPSVTAAVDLALIEKLGRADLYWRAHRRARFVWSRSSNILLAAIAVSGALSGGSVLADIPVAAVVLGITTAVLSGANAGLQPAEKAAQHREAAAGYGQLFRVVERLLCERAETELGWEQLRISLVSIDSTYDRIEKEAPSVKPTRTERDDAVRRVTFVLTGEPTGTDQGSAQTW
jgi:hypothetical protein